MIEVLSSQYVYRGHIVKLRIDQTRLANNHIINAEVVDHAGAVAVVALDAENRVLLARQYRFGAGKELLEIPAGTLEKSEDPALCATRELKEETGYSALQLQYLGHYYSTPGFCNEDMHIYLAQQLTPGQTHFDRDEEIKTEKISLDQAVAMIERGEITDGKTIIGLLRVWKMLHG